MAAKLDDKAKMDPLINISLTPKNIGSIDCSIRLISSREAGAMNKECKLRNQLVHELDSEF